MAVDFHLHSSFSDDSDTPMESMILEGIRRGFTTLCFTEHMDFDFPSDQLPFLVDTKSYHETYLTLKEKYSDRIELLFGIELGLQPHLSDRLTSYLEKWPFDFVIGSSHVIYGQDPYYPEFFYGRDEKEAYHTYFESILKNLEQFSSIDSYGHLDYIVRYGPNQNRDYSYRRYQEIFDEILKNLIDKQIGLEVNTSGLKYGLGQTHPTREIITRYHELGGEIITIGSDGHKPEHLGYDFHLLPTLLKSCGFSYYTVYRKRTPHFYSLNDF